MVATFIISLASSSEGMWRYEVKVLDGKGQPVLGRIVEVCIENSAFSGVDSVRYKAKVYPYAKSQHEYAYFIYNNSEKCAEAIIYLGERKEKHGRMPWNVLVQLPFSFPIESNKLKIGLSKAHHEGETNKDGVFHGSFKDASEFVLYYGENIINDAIFFWELDPSERRLAMYRLVAKSPDKYIATMSSLSAEVITKHIYGMSINFEFFDEVSRLPLDMPANKVKISRLLANSKRDKLTTSEGKVSFKPSDLFLHVEVDETEIWERYEDKVRIPLGQPVLELACSLRPKCIPLRISGRCIDKDVLEDLAGCKIEVFSQGAKEPFAKYLSDEMGLFDFTISRPPKMKLCKVKITKDGYKSVEKEYRLIEKKRELCLGVITIEHYEKVPPLRKQVQGMPEGSIRLAGRVFDPDGEGIGNAQVALTICTKKEKEVCWFRLKTDPSGRFLEYISVPEYPSGEPLKYYVKVVPEDQTRFEISERSYKKSDFWKEIQISLRKAGKPYLVGSVQNMPKMIHSAKVLLYWGEEVKRYNAIPDKSKVKEISPFDLTYVDENGDFTFISSEKPKPGEYGLLLQVKDRITWCYPEPIKFGDGVEKNIILEPQKEYFYRNSSIKVLGEKVTEALLIETKFIIKDAFQGIIPVPLPRKALGMVDLVGVPLNAIKKIHLIPRKEGFSEVILRVAEIPEGKKVVLAKAKEKDLVVIWLPYAKETDVIRGVSPCKKKVMRIGEILSSSDNPWRRWYVVSENIIISDSQWKKRKEELLGKKTYRGPLISLPAFLKKSILEPFVKKLGKDLANVQVLLILDAEALPIQSPTFTSDVAKDIFMGLNLSRFCILIYSHYHNQENMPPILKEHIKAINRLVPKKGAEYHLIHLDEDKGEKQTLGLGYHLPRLWWYND